jgi:putative membrane protein
VRRQRAPRRAASWWLVVHTRAPQVLAALFAIEIAWSAWRPVHPQDWAMENLLTLVTSWWLVRRYRERPFSNLSYLLLFLFGSSHVLGSHYTYSLLPYDEWFRALFQVSLDQLIGATRNGYDRFVHFLFGLLCYLPVRELLRSRAIARGAGSYVLPGAIIVTIATFYELVEWWAMELFGGDLGQSFLGMQGDIWDAQKDVLVAVVGAVLASAAIAISARRRRNQPQGPERVRADDDRVVYLPQISRHRARDLVRRLREAARRSDQ